MKYFVDCEFHEHDYGIELISIGMVMEDPAAYFYVESSDYDWEKCEDDWLRKNVLPHLGPPASRRTRREIGQMLRDYTASDPSPELWGWFCDYDWVVICQLFGRMVDLPENWPWYCRDLKQHVDMLGFPKAQMPSKPEPEHHALADAKWIRAAHRLAEQSREATMLRAARDQRLFHVLDIAMQAAGYQARPKTSP